MAEPEPAAEQLSSPGGAPLTALTWADARTRLADNGDYLLATSGADGRVHMVPVLAVWLEGAVCFVTRRQTRKARDLATNDYCAITVPGHDVDLVVEGTANLVRDAARLQRIADLYPIKYPWWHPFVREGEFHDPADTALSDPQHVFAVAPRVVFAFGKEEGFSATRWRF
ncbi:Nitroimidazol reductase NimA, pyridoxamine 5'-phosphate oxidase superfamily [Amycolatopsis marina]|uniref:Nitroimidazol reductase NimA, pyridoxamine 5'-phosphate oxidase superfamily n=1 Tax=Amycolatopsis marina TaxID=490629 RepID=A0A1I0ZJH5_9PSEU|nr:pyridoxamine 5'-phosphate oxidase family protein [Amycolatopsis marina]SFB25805.1 Nitroimidazol reductase NimA, pyridoxamine 5'-phosphate oxidase superfamily [Amycolatopsis marina]